jgi:hypothetical protein
MKSTLTVALGLLLAAGPVSAAGLRFGEPGFPGTPAPSAITPHHGCGQVQALVARNNHAILTEGPGNWFTGYGTLRVVKDHRFCLHGEGASPTWMRTRDTAQCFVGFTCSEGGERGSRRGGR